MGDYEAYKQQYNNLVEAIILDKALPNEEKAALFGYIGSDATDISHEDPRCYDDVLAHGRETQTPNK